MTTIAEIQERLKRVPRDMDELNQQNRDFVLNAPEDVAAPPGRAGEVQRSHFSVSNAPRRIRNRWA